MGHRRPSGFVKRNICCSGLRPIGRPGGSHVIIPTELTRYRNKFPRAVQNWYTRDHRAERPPDLLDPHNVHARQKCHVSGETQYVRMGEAN